MRRLNEAMNEPSLKRILEALLMSAPQPLTLDAISSVFADWEKPNSGALQHALADLIQDYQDRAIELVCLAGGYCFQTKACYAPWVGRLYAEKPLKYSPALFEVLSIIAYKQPVTRGDIEAIRGVSVSTPLLKTLLEREWIRTAGHRDVIGKPLLYVTTLTFLNDFNLASLQDLPILGES